MATIYAALALEEALKPAVHANPPAQP
jgi:hypothetical protein